MRSVRRASGFVLTPFRLPIACELRFHGESYRWEAQCLERGGLLVSRGRFITHALRAQWAEEERNLNALKGMRSFNVGTTWEPVLPDHVAAKHIAAIDQPIVEPRWRRGVSISRWPDGSPIGRRAYAAKRLGVPERPHRAGRNSG